QAGVAFSLNPITNNQNEIMIEAVHGLGELLVQGLATPDNYILDKQSGRVLESDIANKLNMLSFKNGKTDEIRVPTHSQNTPALDPHQLQQLAGLVRSVEAHYGFPVDIEWAFEQCQLYLLQARPITTI